MSLGLHPDEIPLRPVSWVQQQAGVLAWLPGLDPVRFALVTSRRTGRWVFPKGGIDAGMTAHEAAAQEAYEEAGLIGTPLANPVGGFMIPKIRPPMIWTIEVTLYAMPVDDIHDVWLEAGQRLRRFVTIEEARALMTEPEMLDLAERFVARRLESAQAAG